MGKRGREEKEKRKISGREVEDKRKIRGRGEGEKRESRWSTTVLSFDN